MKPIEIRNMALEHVRIVATRLRHQDEVEVSTLTGKPAVEALERSVYLSEYSFTAFDGDEPIALLGLGSYDGKVGVPWMVGTDALPKAAHRWLHTAHGWVDWMQSIYPVLSNVVHKDNHQSIRWLKRLGFQFLDTPIPGHPDFIQFVRYQ
jgi:hypothetical protein